MVDRDIRVDSQSQNAKGGDIIRDGGAAVSLHSLVPVYTLNTVLSNHEPAQSNTLMWRRRDYEASTSTPSGVDWTRAKPSSC